MQAYSPLPFGAVLSGLGWGYSAWVFYPIMAGEHELSLLVLVLAGMTAGATRSLGPIPAACWSFQLLTLLPLIARLLLGGGLVQTVMGFLAVLYLRARRLKTRTADLVMAAASRCGLTRVYGAKARPRPAM